MNFFFQSNEAMNHSGDIITAQDQFSRILMVCHTHNPLEQLDIIISIILKKKRQMNVLIYIIHIEHTWVKSEM